MGATFHGSTHHLTGVTGNHGNGLPGGCSRILSNDSLERRGFRRVIRAGDRKRHQNDTCAGSVRHDHQDLTMQDKAAEE